VSRTLSSPPDARARGGGGGGAGRAASDGGGLSLSSPTSSTSASSSCCSSSSTSPFSFPPLSLAWQRQRPASAAASALLRQRSSVRGGGGPGSSSHDLFMGGALLLLCTRTGNPSCQVHSGRFPHLPRRFRLQRSSAAASRHLLPGGDADVYSQPQQRRRASLPSAAVPRCLPPSKPTARPPDASPVSETKISDRFEAECELKKIDEFSHSVCLFRVCDQQVVPANSMCLCQNKFRDGINERSFVKSYYQNAHMLPIWRSCPCTVEVPEGAPHCLSGLSFGIRDALYIYFSSGTLTSFLTVLLPYYLRWLSNIECKPELNAEIMAFKEYLLPLELNAEVMSFRDYLLSLSSTVSDTPEIKQLNL
ncbi:hypothetical protein U9M48_001611, partial [Paspalum notatum var. saurae]